MVIDTPPHSIADAAEAARRADLVLARVESHLFTLETLPKFADLLKIAGTAPALVVINKAAVKVPKRKMRWSASGARGSISALSPCTYPLLIAMLGQCRKGRDGA